jgi:hypothetical protein
MRAVCFGGGDVDSDGFMFSLICNSDQAESHVFATKPNTICHTAQVNTLTQLWSCLFRCCNASLPPAASLQVHSIPWLQSICRRYFDVRSWMK